MFSLGSIIVLNTAFAEKRRIFRRIWATCSYFLCLEIGKPVISRGGFYSLEMVGIKAEFPVSDQTTGHLVPDIRLVNPPFGNFSGSA